MPVDTVDFCFPPSTMFRPPRYPVRRPFWEDFVTRSVHHIFSRGGFILDIGGGLRIDGTRGNRVSPTMARQFSRYLTDTSVQYNVTDYTDQYHPDFIEDIHALSFQNSSVDGLFCMAVLEHVYDPKRAAEELVRVLKKGAEAFLYVPFIYRYHANLTDDYRDYFRYSKDGIEYLFRECSSVTICPVRGIFESLLRFLPLHRCTPLVWCLRIIDWKIPAMRRISERQTSGYFIHIVK